jgi:hypothetical protein
MTPAWLPNPTLPAPLLARRALHQPAVAGPPSPATAHLPDRRVQHFMSAPFPPKSGRPK